MLCHYHPPPRIATMATQCSEAGSQFKFLYLHKHSEPKEPVETQEEHSTEKVARGTDGKQALTQLWKSVLTIRTGITR